MIEPAEMVVTMLLGSAIVALATVLGAGVRRIAWHYAALIGLGNGIVFAAVYAATFNIDPSSLVLVGAIGGGLALRGFDRGEQERRRVSTEITSIRSAPPV
jgi:hypothetical protein